MVMPFLSVSMIGLLVGATGHLVRPGSYSVLRGFFGAWAGFAAGALAGLLVDVATQSGLWVALIGHVAALGGAVLSQWIDISPPDQVGE